jgi:predicted nucleic acid-binding Zn ribbon protein
VSSRSAPRPLASALGALVPELAPCTTLARVQERWPLAAGELIAAEARPVAEREGLLTVACSASVWAQELDLMAPELLSRLNAELGEPAIRKLRCVTA